MSAFTSGKSRDNRHAKKKASYDFAWISKDLALVDEIKSREKLLKEELKEIKAEEIAISREISRLRRLLK